jgi:hypothetical protein
MLCFIDDNDKNWIRELLIPRLRDFACFEGGNFHTCDMSFGVVFEVIGAWDKFDDVENRRDRGNW